MADPAAIIVPTYREAENLPHLVPRITASFEDGEREIEIVVVDDDSRDGTKEVCQQLSRAHPLRLITRTDQRGLSSAVLAGFRECHTPLLAVMDADLSHPPEKLPELFRALDAGADFALGSRYIDGGATEQGWGRMRLVNSKVATLLARPLVSVTDPMAGFFAIRRSRLEAAPTLDPLGFKIGLELIVKCGCTHVHEVPIHFSKRLHGESKLGLREQWNYVRHLRRLYVFRLVNRR